MLSDTNYIKILNYFDRQFWDEKTDETKLALLRNYLGLVF